MNNPLERKPLAPRPPWPVALSLVAAALGSLGCEQSIKALGEVIAMMMIIAAVVLFILAVVALVVLIASLVALVKNLTRPTSSSVAAGGVLGGLFVLGGVGECISLLTSAVELRAELSAIGLSLLAALYGAGLAASSVRGYRQLQALPPPPPPPPLPPPPPPPGPSPGPPPAWP